MQKNFLHLGQVIPAQEELSGEALGRTVKPQGCKHVRQNCCTCRGKSHAPLSPLEIQGVPASINLLADLKTGRTPHYSSSVGINICYNDEKQTQTP